MRRKETNKMEEKNKQQEEESPFVKEGLLNGDSEFEGVKIGEILLQSSKLRCDQLCQLAINLLATPLIKKYLSTTDIKKFKGTYVG